MARRRHVVYLASALALVAGAAVAGPSTAAPPTPDGTYVAPYTGFAGFGSSLRCEAGATCHAEGNASSLSGKGTTTSTFDRSTPVGGRESAFGYASQSFTVKTRPGTSSVSATFSWVVESSSVEATAASGLVQAYTGVLAFAANCDGECTSEVKSASVQYAGSTAGVPSTGLQPAAKTASVTVTATGKLPRQLTFYGYPYSVAAGDVSQVCPPEQSACTVLAEEHAGSAKASITASLSSVTVTSS